MNDLVMPSAPEAELAVLGALLYDNLTYEQVSEFLKSDHFHDPVHQKLYAAITHTIQKGNLANYITIAPFMLDDEAVKDRGGEAYIRTISKSILSLQYVGEYGKQILDAYIRRELIRIGSGVVTKSQQYEVGKDATTTIEDTEHQLFQLASTNQNSKIIRPFGKVMEEVIYQSKLALSNDSHTVGIPTGLVDLDRHLGGLHPSDLIILAGRPSMGKTALATNIAFFAANYGGKGVAFFSLEMSAEQLAMRILGQEAGISPDKLRKGTITQSDVTNLISHSRRLANAPFYIDDTPALTIAGLRTRARRLYRQDKISLIVIDYLQLLSAGTGTESRVQELSFITRSLKALAKELNIPVLALSQLSRAVEQRDDKRPQLSDLRESGTIEQDADVVMFVFREAYYESRKKPPETSPKMGEWQARMNKIHNTAELMIAKQRHGPIKNIMLHFHDSLTKFGNYCGDDEF